MNTTCLSLKILQSREWMERFFHRSNTCTNSPRALKRRPHSNGSALCRTIACAPPSEAGLPGTLLAQLRDVSRVMASVPRIEKQQPIHGSRSVFRVDEHTAELVIAQSTKQPNPAIVHGVQ